jgi:hypothetical protein
MSDGPRIVQDALGEIPLTGVGQCRFPSTSTSTSPVKGEGSCSEATRMNYVS